MQYTNEIGLHYLKWRVLSGFVAKVTNIQLRQTRKQFRCSNSPPYDSHQTKKRKKKWIYQSFRLSASAAQSLMP